MSSFYVVKRLLQYVAKYRWSLAGLIAIALIGVLFQVAKPLPIKLVIDNVLMQDPLPEIVYTVFGQQVWLNDRQGLLIACIVALVLISLGSALFSYFTLKMTVNIGRHLVLDLSKELFDKLQILSPAFYAKHKIGDLTQRINGDIFVVYFIVGQIVIPVFTALLSLGVMFYIMTLIDLQLALIAISVIPLFALSLVFFSGPMNDTVTKQYQTQGAIAAFVQQALMQIKVVQTFTRERYMKGLFNREAEEASVAFEKSTMLGARYEQTNNLITGVASAVLIGIGAFKGFNGSVSAGDLYVFLGYLGALYGPVQSLTEAVGAGVAIGARGKRVFEILDSPDFIPEHPYPDEPRKIFGDIHIENVSFAYHPEKKILKGIDLHIPSGKTIALIGATGAGKTSLISLLNRFFDPQRGRILLDGIDTRRLKLKTLRENISLVMQEPYLFPVSIAENIAMGNPAASRTQIEEAAKKAQAHGFITKLPKAYDTSISEAGSSLSGGERQRIALARAFLKEAPIIILDEPTSALDALTEASIFDALNEFSRGKTIIIISHRLSTIKGVDQIITLKDGEVLESGTHEYLMEKGALYAELYKLQTIEK